MNGNSTFVAPTVTTTNDINDTGVYENRQKQVYIYQGPAPPSYWDSPISASQLIVTCILLIILCLIYNYSNFDEDDEEKVGKNKNFGMQQVQAPSTGEGVTDHDKTRQSELNKMDPCLKGLVQAQNTGSQHEAIAMRDVQPEGSASLHSSQRPTAFYGMSKFHSDV